MINRVLIRIKVLQLLYSYRLNPDDINGYERDMLQELAACFDDCYLLYFHLLKLPVDLTYLRLRRLDEAMHNNALSTSRVDPSSDPFVNNSIIADLEHDEVFARYIDTHPEASWDRDALFMKRMLDKVLASEAYKWHMSLEQMTRTDDCRLWCQLLRDVIFTDPDFLQNIEETNSLWSEDDVTLIGQFVIKTLKQIEYGNIQPLLPMFRPADERYDEWEGDAHFGERLMRATLANMENNSQLIDNLVDGKKWDAERIAVMDRLILCMAIAEVIEFDTIPAVVTINEAVELAKNFSTDNSGAYVNGILHAAIVELRAQGVIIK